MHYSNTLQGGSPDNITPDGISKQDTYFYRYPADQEIADSRLRIVYLGYYIEDWSLMKNAELGIKKGMKIRSEPSNKTGDYFGFSALDEEFKIVNAMIKYIKYGYGAVTDQVIIAMNNGLLDRKQAYEAVQKYDGKCDQYYIDLFCDYLEISKNEFWSVVESYRGKDAWKKDSNGKWVLRAESPLF